MKEEYEYKEPSDSKIVEYINILIATVMSVIWAILILLFLSLPVIAVLLFILMLIA